MKKVLREIEVRGNGFDGMWLLAVMNFPEDVERRRAFYAVRYAEHVLKESNGLAEVALSVEHLDDILRSVIAGDFRAQLKASTKRGIVAGDELLANYFMVSFPQHFPEPSRSKAIWAVRWNALETDFGDGSEIPKTDLGIRNYFSSAAAVAHLWAAFRYLSALLGSESREMLASAAAVRVFLEISAEFQRFGCGFSAKRAKSKFPLLDEATIWRVPESIRPRIPPLGDGPPDWLVAAYKKYRPRKR